MAKLEQEFYLNPDVVTVARELLGKVLFTKINGKITGGIITETEAYNGIIDRASHAYGGRRSSRTEIMYSRGGTAYVYLCYGIHSLFNVVTNETNIPHAVLVRSIYPFSGEKIILNRRNARYFSPALLRGPGKVAAALGIHHSQTGISLLGNKIWIEDCGVSVNKSSVSITPRIGVEYAGTDALLPYRFDLKYSP
jgi:DNA-3-methyladenine glycosylase